MPQWIQFIISKFPLECIQNPADHKHQLLSVISLAITLINTKTHFFPSSNWTHRSRAAGRTVPSGQSFRRSSEL